MKGDLLMSAKERKRKSLFDLVLAKAMTLKKASELLSMDYRQLRRSFNRYVEEGDAGLVHRSRGVCSNRAVNPDFRQSVLGVYRARYSGFGPTFASEKLAEDGYEVTPETLRRWLIKDKQWEKRRKRAAHRSWRERKAHFGELVQMDGSPHCWFGLEHPPACLMNMVDDARGVTLSAISQEETTESAMRLLWQWIEQYGIPVALYTDRKNVYLTDREPTIEEQLADVMPLTAFGRACKTLDITIIGAHSPQAKGRVERNHGVYQDRLVKELALRGITTIEETNAFLNNGFIERLNTRFAVQAADSTDFHRPVPKDLNLADMLCWEETRVVHNDWSVRHNNQRYQIVKSNHPLPRAKDKIIVRTRLDRSIALIYRDRELQYVVLPAEAVEASKKTKTPQPQEQPAKPSSKRTQVNKTPWRQGCTMMAADTDKKEKEDKPGKGGKKK